MDQKQRKEIKLNLQIYIVFLSLREENFFKISNVVVKLAKI